MDNQLMATDVGRYAAPHVPLPIKLKMLVIKYVQTSLKGPHFNLP